MWKLVTLIIESLTGETAEAWALKILNITKSDLQAIRSINRKLNKVSDPISEAKSILSPKALRGVLPVKTLNNLLPDKIFQRIQKLPKQARKEMINAIRSGNNDTVKTGQYTSGKDIARKGQSNTGNYQLDLLFNFDGEITLQSSFLQYGIFELNIDKPDSGHLILAMGGKEYDMGTVQTTIWMQMVSAVGKNGTGAGSVLWDTLWYHKRKKTLSTGGVAGSVEKLIKRRTNVWKDIQRRKGEIAKFQDVKKIRGIKNIQNMQKIRKMARISSRK